MKQAVAAVGQGRLMRIYDDLFSALNQPIAQVLLTRSDLAQRSRYVNSYRTFRQLLQLGVVPIVNENDTVAVEELKFGDNDTLSALVASLIGAQWLFILTDVDAQRMIIMDNQAGVSQNFVMIRPQKWRNFDWINALLGHQR